MASTSKHSIYMLLYECCVSPNTTAFGLTDCARTIIRGGSCCTAHGEHTAQQSSKSFSACCPSEKREHLSKERPEIDACQGGQLGKAMEVRRGYGLGSRASVTSWANSATKRWCCQIPGPNRMPNCATKPVRSLSFT